MHGDKLKSIVIRKGYYGTGTVYGDRDGPDPNYPLKNRESPIRWARQDVHCRKRYGRFCSETIFWFPIDRSGGFLCNDSVSGITLEITILQMSELSAVVGRIVDQRTKPQ